MVRRRSTRLGLIALLVAAVVPLCVKGYRNYVWNCSIEAASRLETLGDWKGAREAYMRAWRTYPRVTWPRDRADSLDGLLAETESGISARRFADGSAEALADVMSSARKTSPAQAGKPDTGGGATTKPEPSEAR